MKLEWLIVGGGIHGVHIAARLLADAGIPRDRLRLVDPASRLLEGWRSRTAATGMTHLRSPSVHHLDLAPWSLLQFGKRKPPQAIPTFAPPYQRPALALFNEHCEGVIDSFSLAELHVQDRATEARVSCDGVELRLASGSALTTRNLVLAIGGCEATEWPAWATRDNPRVHHIFDHEFDFESIFAAPHPKGQRVAVVGGGISAAQVALRLLDLGHEVSLASRHALRINQFDSDPGWLGPKYMDDFQSDRDTERRRALITEARHVGSVPPDVAEAIGAAVERGLLQWHQGSVVAAHEGTEGVRLDFDDGFQMRAEQIVLATGFTKKRPGGALVDSLIASAQLPCAGCGYPVVDAELRWHPRVFVSGPLAELEIGPVARNIAGARYAANRLVAVALNHPEPVIDRPLARRQQARPTPPGSP